MFTNSESALARRMVADQLQPRGIVDARVFEAMVNVPRHRFVSPNSHTIEQAYGDYPIPIGQGQTISQPFMVASMTQLLDLHPGQKVLEIGTGCGYQTAILLEMGANVWSIERFESLLEPARRLLTTLAEESGHSEQLQQRLHLVTGDGTLGWQDGQPYDRIIVTAGAPALPQAYRQQLNPRDGRILIPIGDRQSQTLTRFTTTPDGLAEEKLYDCRFVPLTGAHGWSADETA